MPALSLGISGNIAVNAGQLMIFELVGSEWVQTATLAGTSGTDLEIDGERILVSAPGSAWNAFRNEGGKWRQFRLGCCNDPRRIPRRGRRNISGQIIAVASPPHYDGSGGLSPFTGLRPPVSERAEHRDRHQ